jgi:hypothetical protein
VESGQGLDLRKFLIWHYLVNMIYAKQFPSLDDTRCKFYILYDTLVHLYDLQTHYCPYNSMWKKSKKSRSSLQIKLLDVVMVRQKIVHLPKKTDGSFLPRLAPSQKSSGPAPSQKDRYNC